MRVLVTGAGAGPAIALIKALKALDSDPDRFVLATDMSPESAGFALADGCEVSPANTAADFVSVIEAACRRHRIEMVIPVLDGDAATLSAAAETFGRGGTRVATHTPQAVQACSDKFLARDVCRSHGIRQPESFAGPANICAESFPILAKPRRGVSARGITVFQSPAAAVAFSEPADGFLWQQFVDGVEFSIDTFSRPSLGDFVAVPRRRDVVKAGQMVRGETCADPDLIAFAAQCCEAFGLIDVACLQVIRQRGTNELFFVEANPRYGTGVSLSIAAGVFFPRLQYLRHFSRQPIPVDWLTFQSGVRMVRFWEEIFAYPGRSDRVVGLTPLPAELDPSRRQA
jgi:carbamoyl-phosphate synthase large subunit